MTRVCSKPNRGAALGDGRSRRGVTVLASVILIVGGLFGMNRLLREEAAALPQGGPSDGAFAYRTQPGSDCAGAASAARLQQSDPPSPLAPADRAAFNGAGFAEPIVPHYLEPEPPRTPIVGPPIDYSPVAGTGTDPTTLAEQSRKTEKLETPRSGPAATE